MLEAKNLFRQYCQAWEQSDVAGLLLTLADDIYIKECYGPEYHGREEVGRWARQWLSQNTNVRWEIKNILVGSDDLAAEWDFSFQKANGETRAVVGASLVTFYGNKIKTIQEYWQTNN